MLITSILIIITKSIPIFRRGRATTHKFSIIIRTATKETIASRAAVGLDEVVVEPLEKVMEDLHMWRAVEIHLIIITTCRRPQQIVEAKLLEVTKENTKISTKRDTIIEIIEIERGKIGKTDRHSRIAVVVAMFRGTSTRKTMIHKVNSR